MKLHPTACCTCTADLDEDEMFIVAVQIKRLNGEPITAEIELCPDCVLDIDCVVLLDNQDQFGPGTPKVRERIGRTTWNNDIDSPTADWWIA
jgi:hypothetical protein